MFLFYHIAPQGLSRYAYAQQPSVADLDRRDNQLYIILVLFIREINKILTIVLYN